MAESTREKLLAAAAEVFAERGYEDATIRLICARAGANVALVNYHFGDKLELYTEVLKSTLQAGQGSGLSSIDPATPPAEALEKIVTSMIERGLESGDRASLRFRLMMNEFGRPSEATARIVDVALRPVYKRLSELVGAVAQLPPEHETVRLTVHSILGQVTHFAHSRRMLSLLWPEMEMTPSQRERVAKHITRMALTYLDEAPSPALARLRGRG